AAQGQGGAPRFCDCRSPKAREPAPRPSAILLLALGRAYERGLWAPKSELLSKSRTLTEFFVNDAGFYRDVDFKDGGHIAPMHRNFDLLRVDRDMLCDGIQDFLVEN